MSVNLQKGQKVDLTKGNKGLKKVMVGLGWDEAKKGGLLGLFGGAQDIDCDAMAFLLGEDGKIESKRDVIFYNNLRHYTGSVVHQGDNLTGRGEGDDEQILIDLAALPGKIQRVVMLVSIYEADKRKQHFGMIRNAFIRLVDAEKRQELCIYNLSENYDGMRSMIFGEVYRHNGDWKFSAIGQPLSEWSVTDLARRYGLVWK